MTREDLGGNMDGKTVDGSSGDLWPFKGDSRSSSVNAPKFSKGVISTLRLNDWRMVVAVQTIAMKPSPPAMPPIMEGMLRGEGPELSSEVLDF